MLIISCHADTCETSHQCEDRGDSFFGHMDNFSGVHAVMKAFFSGRLRHDHVRIELTYGEEEDMDGAREVLRTLRKQDVVMVVDVTGTPTGKDLVIEKCTDAGLRRFLSEALDGIPLDIYEDCPDPIADEDEVDVYVEKIPRVFMLAIPCSGGDYNAEKVTCRKRSIESVAEAICRIVEKFPDYCDREGIGKC
jgi:hypothetical protein